MRFLCSGLLAAALPCLASTALLAQSQPDVWKTAEPAPIGQPNADDLVWEKSVAQFDGQRAKLDHDVDLGAAKGPFHPEWPSLEGYRIPAWYQDAKFGIFIHFGAYSTPAFGSEWYPRNMYLQGSKEYKHQTQTYGPETKFGYKDFLPMFRAEGFDANAWAALFREAGAKYVIPVAEHHDGFPMYSSDLTDWSAAKMGPKRDVIGELRTAVLADGMHFGASSHRAEHYFFMNGGRAHPSDVQDPRYAAFYGPAHVGPDPEKDQTGHPDPAYLNDWLARSAEIVEKYHPELVYFDWWVEQPEFQPYLKRFAAFYYNQAAAHGQQVVLFRKNDAFPPHTTVMDIERGQADRILPEHWQTDTPVTNASWGYIEDDTYKTPETILWQLIDIVSKNGNLLLDVGPKPDGTITPEAQQVLRALGAWLRVNGEAIYATRPWTTYGEGPTQMVGGRFNDAKLQPYTAQDIRFTTRGSTLYATALGWPASGKLVIHSIRDGGSSDVHLKVAHVSLLGSSSPIQWKQGADGLTLFVPAKAPAGLPAYTFKLQP